MVRTLLVRGMLVGIVAGLLSFGFLKIYGEPQVGVAIAFETQQDLAKEASASPNGTPVEHHDELVSRKVQAGLGLFTAVMVYCTAFGGLFALAFAFAYGRTPGVLTPQAVSLLLAAAGFVAVYLVPSLKYPANPPSVGQPETIGYRTALYFSMLALSVAAMVLAAVLRKHLAVRHGGWTAALTAIGFYLVAVIMIGSILPAISEVPSAFPAVVLWRFRVASFAMQVIMWATLGLAFGALTERALAKQGAFGRQSVLGRRVFQ
jgi:predicted cobalt transporter CbtA